MLAITTFCWSFGAICLRVPKNGITSLPVTQELTSPFLKKTPNLYMSLGLCPWYHSANIIATSFSINHSRMKKIEVLDSQRRGTKVARVQCMDEFLSISDNDDDTTGAAPAAPAEGNVPAKGMYQIRLLCQFRLIYLHKLIYLHESTCVHMLTWHLKLLHVVNEAYSPEEIMKLWSCA